MDSMSLMSSPNVCLLTTGGNILRSKHSTKSTYASFVAPKASMQQRKNKIEYNLSRFQQPSMKNQFKRVEGGFIYKENDKKYVPKAINKESFDSQPRAFEPKDMLGSIKHFFVTLFWFCYPYTMIGRTICTISVSLLAVDTLSDISPLFFRGLLQTLVSYTFIDLYVNGVNQLCDLEIDKINKPFLPLPSGAFSVRTGVIITASSAILGFLISYMVGSWPIFWGLLLFSLIWSAYSINAPLLRWKKSPLLAAICIFSTMTFIFPLSFFYHMKTFVFKRAAVFPKPLMISVAFMSLYSLGIALFKDIPDIEGDKAFGVKSFATRLGQKRVFEICVSIFLSAFGVASVAGLSSPFLWVKIVTGLGFAVLGSIVGYRAKFVDLNDKASIRSYYMMIWQLLYGSYVLLPLIR
ncbi:hypothetical protein VNO80_14696 [Phaseolus coccineus]|uniref:Uncharacterized protein n=1 Tax=Phaseolus coccineus TaxID=3886 RepID=A0AAN9MIF0_PHACN